MAETADLFARVLNQEFQLKRRLNYNSSLFNSLEVNSTFYKVTIASTFEKWFGDVGNDFRFTIKLWKEITHSKELKFNEKDISLVLRRAASIGNKKGLPVIAVSRQGKGRFVQFV